MGAGVTLHCLDLRVVYLEAAELRALARVIGGVTGDALRSVGEAGALASHAVRRVARDDRAPE